ncbi:hypothetical protein [Vibrio sp. 03_296]|nr:hypothetical protein [Vibrio sp. 03_296]
MTMKALLITLVIGLATSPLALAEKPNWRGKQTQQGSSGTTCRRNDAKTL